LPRAQQVNTVYSSLISQGRLACATSHIQSVILQASPSPSLDQIRSYDTMIEEIYDHMPPYMKDLSIPVPWHLARAVTLWRVRDFRAILYRPILLAAAWDSVKAVQMQDGTRRAIE